MTQPPDPHQGPQGREFLAPPPSPAGPLPPPYLPPVVVAPATLPSTPVVPTEYHQFLRTPRHRWYKPLLLILLVLGGWFLVGQVLLTPVVIWQAMHVHGTFAAAMANIDDPAVLASPAVITGNNLTLALFIPAAMLGQWAVYGQRPRWTSSVVGGLRWRWLLTMGAIILVLWLGYTGVEVALSGGLKIAPDRLLLWLVIIVLTVPLQSAGEEYGLRGSLNRAVAAWFGNRIVALAAGAVVSGLVFMSLHLAADPWLNVFYFSFGIISALLAWRTGGLEVSIAVHVVNNLVAFTLTAVSGDWDSIFDRQVGTGSPTVLIPVVALLVVLAIAEVLRRRMGITRIAAPGALPAAQTGVAENR